MKRAARLYLAQAARLLALAFEHWDDDEQPEVSPVKKAPMDSIEMREAREELRRRGVTKS